jgi:hypothetical protein
MLQWRYSSTFLSLGTRWRWVVSSRLLPLYSPAKEPQIHWIGGWVGPRIGVNAVEKWKNLALAGIEPGPSSPSLYRLGEYMFPTKIVLESWLLLIITYNEFVERMFTSKELKLPRLVPAKSSCYDNWSTSLLEDSTAEIRQQQLEYRYDLITGKILTQLPRKAIVLLQPSITACSECRATRLCGNSPKS